MTQILSIEQSRKEPGGELIYPPLNTLKAVADNLWIVDGPVIYFGARWLSIPFPTRMTVIRMFDGSLLIHSPTPPTACLTAELEVIGTPRWIIGPNRFHYWWIPQWRDRYPAAEVYLVPGIREQAGEHIGFAAHDLTTMSGYPWEQSVSTHILAGSYFTEFVFFHRMTRTLVLTDAIENFEASKLNSALMRWLTRLGAVRDPDGQMPRDMRLTFRRNRAELLRTVEALIELDPQRIILSHGRWYTEDGAQELRRAFRWLLPNS